MGMWLFIAALIMRCISNCYGDIDLDFRKHNQNLGNYSSAVPPSKFVSDPTIVDVNVYINSFGSVSAATMDYSIDIYLRQTWLDQRLEMDDISQDFLILSRTEEIKKIWQPGLYFKNIKDSHFHKVPSPNAYILIYPNGTVLSSMRLTLKLSCQMNLEKYPQDVQHCYVKIASYAFPNSAVILHWSEDNPVEIAEGIEIPEFDFVSTKLNDYKNNPCIDKYVTGSFSCLNITFELSREYRYHVIQTYTPTVLIVMISWVSCWLDPGAIPARVTLGVTTLLTLTTLASGVRTKLPPVSYIKAIDVWMGTCMIFVFGALLEFTIVNYWYRRKDADGELMVRRAKNVDWFARIFFPIMFAIFFVAYWIYYAS